MMGGFGVELVHLSVGGVNQCEAKKQEKRIEGSFYLPLNNGRINYVTADAISGPIVL